MVELNEEVEVGERREVGEGKEREWRGGRDEGAGGEREADVGCGMMGRVRD